MASNAISGLGVKFYRWDTVSPSWDAIAEITAIDGPSKARETIEVTALDSPDGYREFIAGLRDGGSISLTMNFTHDTYSVLNTDFESNVIQNYLIAIPDDDHTQLEFAGLVTELPFNISVGDAIKANATIKVTGKVYIYHGGSDVPTASPGEIDN